MQLKASIALTLASVVAAGCAQNVIPQPPLPAPGPVGKAQNVIAETPPRPGDKSAIALDCSGLLQGWNNCMLTASKTCGTRGYTILDRSDQRPPHRLWGTLSAIWATFILTVVAYYNNENLSATFGGLAGHYWSVRSWLDWTPQMNRLERIQEAYAEAETEQPLQYDPLPKWETLPIELREEIIHVCPE